jgi:hypothetical protein
MAISERLGDTGKPFDTVRPIPRRLSTPSGMHSKENTTAWSRRQQAWLARKRSLSEWMPSAATRTWIFNVLKESRAAWGTGGCSSLVTEHRESRATTARIKPDEAHHREGDK